MKQLSLTLTIFFFSLCALAKAPEQFEDRTRLALQCHKIYENLLALIPHEPDNYCSRLLVKAADDADGAGVAIIMKNKNQAMSQLEKSIGYINYGIAIGCANQQKLKSYSDELNKILNNIWI